MKEERVQFVLMTREKQTNKQTYSRIKKINMNNKISYDKNIDYILSQFIKLDFKST